jgi:Phage P22-like portal protein
MADAYNTKGGDAADAAGTTAPKADWPDIHKEALLEYERAWEKERLNIEEAYEDLRFRRGNLADQWTPEALAVRFGRPCFVVNLLPQFIRQVTGDMRQSRPGIKVVPVNDKADIKVADVRGGIVRYIENRSKAKHIYTAAGDQQVAAGISHWQVTTEYSAADTFNQEIRIESIPDGIGVLWDADAVRPDRSDGNHCFVPHDQTSASFKREWPNATASGFDTSLCGTGTSSAFDGWAVDDFIRTIVYWKKKPIKRTLALMPDGSIDDLTDVMAGIPKAQLQDAFEWFRQNKGARVEERDGYRVCRYILTMAEILEEREWKGLHIPVVPLLGEEVRIGREVYRHGIVRYARDLQRMNNYYASAEAEVIGLQPKSPFVGTKKMFQAYYDQWENANTENLPFLEFDIDPQAPQMKPERQPPPVGSSAIQQARVNTQADMKAAIGIYDAGLGAKSNETSGVAIRNRQQEGDTGTFVYLDNFSLAIQRTGEICDDLIPHVYDTQRQLMIIGDDNRENLVTINRPVMKDGESKIENDLSIGAYHVMIKEGPNYTTRREEARDGMTEFVRAFPAAAPVMGDLIAEAQDWPHAQEIGERLQELLPPPIKAKLEAEKQEREQASGKPPPPPTPQQLQQQQAQQQQEQMQQQAVALEMAEKKARVDEMEAKARKAIAEADRAETEAQIMKQKLAAAHMTELRAIEANDHTIEGMVQDRHHSQDRHAVEMTERGLAAARAMQREPPAQEVQ